MKLKYDILVSKFAFKLNLYHYTPSAMEERFGRDVLAIGEYKPAALRPLTVLNVPVPVGGTATKTLPRGLTLKTPPATVPGAAESVALVDRYTTVLSEDDPGAHVSEMPAEMGQCTLTPPDP